MGEVITLHRVDGGEVQVNSGIVHYITVHDCQSACAARTDIHFSSESRLAVMEESEYVSKCLNDDMIRMSALTVRYLIGDTQ